MIIVITGVSGTGKTTIGRLLSKRLHLPFIEGDDYHSKENVEKMNNGIPLKDEDRLPWLQELSSRLHEAEKSGGAVLACSALKEDYRKVLQSGLNEEIRWIYLEGREEVIRKRLRERKDHFMPEELLQSQLEIAQKPSNAYYANIDEDVNVIVEKIAFKFNRNKWQKSD